MWGSQRRSYTRAVIDRWLRPSATPTLNPWHGPTWRSGRLRFRVAHTSGYGASPELAAAMLRRLDGEGLGGRLRVLGSLDAVLPVGTQGPS